MLPFGTTVSPIVDSATRNTLYASPALILFGAMTVTFLPVETMRGSRMKFLHVKPITQVMRSLSSVSGLNVTETCPVRFLHAYSASSSVVVAVVGAGCAEATRAVAGASETTMVKTSVAAIAERADEG